VTGVQTCALPISSFAELAIQLCHQVQHHLLQHSGIFRKVFGIDGHELAIVYSLEDSLPRTK